MTAQTIIVPYNRVSPVHIPRRDLVLGISDSLALRVTVVESDDPAAQALVLSGGIGGPACTLVIFREGPSGGGYCDYGAPYTSAGTVLFSATGVMSDALGSFDIAIPPGSFTGFPRRSGWLVRLDWSDGTESEILARGSLHLAPSALTTMAPVPILTDDGSTLLVPLEA